ncbi:uncharacterized protein PG998_006773 [Apiospora kogelbergensis]|uniref:uncharacterized protein n=1 Tax=Apiospora kogelbergensis TaxID=1337665 RepID=UPI00312F8902
MRHDNITSIASVAALIAGGDLLSRLPHDVQRLRSEAEIANALRGGEGLRLWMGWGLVPDYEGRMHGNENEAGTSQFGIFVMDEEEEGQDAGDEATLAELETSNMALQPVGYHGVSAEEQNNNVSSIVDNRTNLAE